MSDERAATEIAIRFHEVRKTVPGKDGPTPILDGLTADVPSGKIVTLVGPSGSGKSTILKLCNLLITPDSGEVYVHGTEVRAWKPPALRRYVGLAFQSPTLFPGTVQENLAFGRMLRGEELDHPEQHLQRIGLSPDLLTQRADDLSGGQKQRVALARVLANDPQVLLLDEVTSALDVAAIREVEQYILEIQRNRRLTVLWVTHDLEQARRVGDITWLVVSGRLVEAQATRSFFEAPQSALTQRFLRGELGGGGA
ncbi:ATP-binding cassette domain-containing protein [Alicyclobacillus cycloheptanicus]|uniref:ABC transport system ATP-binding protein n=1 Tax=Alicyclobacillus cycloheptanicus TaxID=1457 RepID=A0ABT9XEC7_9BACL|nr:phosphate ABC transporter ATP-binding protein [Alicyclobacillus cycloheptanicus]MDQ0188632.1 putative ABC transport system ATP-binding protein [Alicyclobacillus cycloheptanicus]WDM00692.1 ATP-binding cassette domain-containing protein [Alicyclobacillus cycloheptanicus]